MQPRAYRQAFVAVVLTSGCGAPFEAVDNGGSSAISPATQPGSDAAATVAAEGQSGGPCQAARTGDDPQFDREVCIAPTTFDMGSGAANLGGMFADHTPVHSVALSAFALDAYEVTVARYRSCVSAGTCAVLTALPKAARTPPTRKRTKLCRLRAPRGAKHDRSVNGMATVDCRPKPNGNTPHVVARDARTLGATRSRA